jgi:hypothetical protein
VENNDYDDDDRHVLASKKRGPIIVMKDPITNYPMLTNLPYERKTSFRLRAFLDLVFASQLCDANGSTTLHPSWL